MLPNFFIAGAPKCGTTALVEYLRTHPQVFFSSLKEPHYFSTDMEGLRNVTREADYEALFADAKPEQRAVGEGSVFYLYSGEAFENIRNRIPDARIIVMFRNPAELVHSLHGQYLYSRNEDQSDLEKAWRLTGARARGLSVPKRCRDSEILRYDRVAGMGQQLERLLRLFPAEQVQWIFFEDFVDDTRGTYLKSLRFLGLDDDGRGDFPPVNQNKRHRLSMLGNFTQRPPRSLVSIGLKAKEALGLGQLGLLDGLRRMNKTTGKRTPLSPELRREILVSYRDDIQRLSELTGRKLDHWLD